MLAKLLDKVDRGRRGRALTMGGLGALLTGSKASAVALLGRGLRDIEAEWRAANPDFQGGLRERWALAIEHYEATHRDPTNRRLHAVGIPIIVGGATGLLIWPRYTPPWALSAGAFALGWGLNTVGHTLYERGGPAFVDDPLAFLAGPLWDLSQLKSALRPSART